MAPAVQRYATAADEPQQGETVIVMDKSEVAEKRRAYHDSSQPFGIYSFSASSGFTLHFAGTLQELMVDIRPKYGKTAAQYCGIYMTMEQFLDGEPCNSTNKILPIYE